MEVPNSKGLFPLHLAAKKGHINVVRLQHLQINLGNSIKLDKFVDVYVLLVVTSM